MFFILTKIFHFLVNPLVWVGILLFIAFLKRDKKRKQLLIISIIVFLFFSFSIPLTLCLQVWNYPLNYKNDVKNNYEIGIVLGGYLRTDIKNLEEFRVSLAANRLLKALELYKAGKIKKLLLTGGSGSATITAFKEAKIARDFLVDIGIDSNDIFFEYDSRNTYESAIQTKKLILKNYLQLPQKSLLLTSGIHMRRSIKCFEKQEIHCDVFSVDGCDLAGINWLAPDNYLIPEGNNLSEWQSLFHEILGFAVYKIKGYC